METWCWVDFFRCTTVHTGQIITGMSLRRLLLIKLEPCKAPKSSGFSNLHLLVMYFKAKWFCHKFCSEVRSTRARILFAMLFMFFTNVEGCCPFETLELTFKTSKN